MKATCGLLSGMKHYFTDSDEQRVVDQLNHAVSTGYIFMRPMLVELLRPSFQGINENVQCVTVSGEQLTLQADLCDHNWVFNT